MTQARTSPDVTRELARFAIEFPALPLDHRVRVHVQRALLDLLGVTLLGAREGAGRLAAAYAHSQGSEGRATVLGSTGRLSPSLAALANGTAAHALDFDDVGLRVGHISASIVPAVLAMSEHIGATGAAFVDAVVVGFEVASRLASMYPEALSPPYAFGYHKPSLYAVFGGTAACGRLLGLTANECTHALGIAASQAGGLRVNFGTMTKPFHAGVSNRTAVEAALLASSGFTSSEEAIEGRYGWHDVLCRGEGDLRSVVDHLGESLALEEGLEFKLFPSCAANHHAIEAVLAVMSQNALTSRDVASVEVHIASRTLNEVLVYPWPTSGLQGKFSLAYNVAAALADGMVTVDTFNDERVPTFESVRRKIRIVGEDGFPQLGARVRVVTTDGRVFDRDQWVVTGGVASPLSWAELVRKFSANTSSLLTAAECDEIVTAVRCLDQHESLHAITDLVRSLDDRAVAR